MTPEPNRPPLAVVQDMYEAFGASDEARLRALIAADVEWVQCPGFPGGAHRHGIDSVLDGVLRGNKARWTDFRLQLDEFLEAGDRVVVIGSYTGSHATTGRDMRAVFTHVYDVTEGQITRFRQFCDTWPMVEAAQVG